VAHIRDCKSGGMSVSENMMILSSSNVVAGVTFDSSPMVNAPFGPLHLNFCNRVSVLDFSGGQMLFLQNVHYHQ
jgi:hypothetical protein